MLTIRQPLLILILRQTEASARAWIDAFFFRASAMLPPDKRMVLSMEHAVPATTISPSSLSSLSGFVDYTAVVASQRAAGKSVSTYLNCLAHFISSSWVFGNPAPSPTQGSYAIRLPRYRSQAFQSLRPRSSGNM